MRLLLLLLFTTVCCYAQQEDIILKVKIIDSIAKHNSISRQASGKIFKKRFLFGKKTVGGFSRDIYLDSITTPDKVRKIFIIKGSYNETLFITKN